LEDSQSHFQNQAPGKGIEVIFPWKASFQKENLSPNVSEMGKTAAAISRSDANK